MGGVLSLRTTEAQRALLRFREEERAFALVLAVLKAWRRDELLEGVLRVYRSRMRSLRKVAATLLDSGASPSAIEALRRFAREPT